jgi:valyl-tRNA synthetase
MSPQIVGQWLSGDPTLYQQVFPFSLRPQAHEIIRTWAFYTLVKSYYHFDSLPWKHVFISGWGLAGAGMEKISKSKGDQALPPLAMIERYSADAVRYWAASTGPGKDSVISEEKIQLGSRLVTKLWNVARFCEPFIGEGSSSRVAVDQTGKATPADRWVLARLNRLVDRATQLMQAYDYAAAKSEIEQFFWFVLADNYLEMCKLRLYNTEHPQRQGAQSALHQVLLTLVKLFAPFLPFVTEEIYQGLFAQGADERDEASARSIHTASWPAFKPGLDDEQAIAVGDQLVEISSILRRYKSEQSLSLGSAIARLQLATQDPILAEQLSQAIPDLSSVCRATKIEIRPWLEGELIALENEGTVHVGIQAIIEKE